MPFERLRATLELDKSGFESELKSAEDDVSGFGERVASAGQRAQRAGTMMTAGITAPLSALGVMSVQTASDIEELQSKSQSVFGEMTEDIRSWADEVAEATNRSRYELERTVTGFQDLLVPMGVAEGQAADMSKELSELATDLSSFHNISQERAASKLQSALVGETEAVREFGVDVRQAAVEQELMNAGLAESAEEASRAEMAQARMNIMVRETEAAHNNATETSDSFANQMRGLRADTEDLRAEIGEQLLPVATTLVGVVSNGVSWFSDLSETQQTAIVVAGGLAAALGPVILTMGLLAQSVVALSGAYGVLTSAKATLAAVNTSTVIPSLTATNLLLSPITLTILTLMATVGALAAAWATDFGNIRGYTEDGVGVIGQLIDWLIDKINSIPGVDIETESVEDKLRDLVGDAGDATDDMTSSLKERVSDPFGMQGATDDIEQQVNGMDMESLGQQSGQEFGMGMESGMQSQLEDAEPIEGWSPQIREALEDGVEGYVSDPEEIEATDTEIDENLFDAVASQGGATPESLGVSEEEFTELQRRYGGEFDGAQSTSMSPSETAAMDMGSMQSTGSQSNGTLTKLLEEVKSLRATVEGPMNLESGRLEFDENGLVRIVDGRIDRKQTEQFNDFEA